MALIGVPTPGPNNLPDPDAVVEVGVFVVLIVGFFALIGQGYSAHEAMGLTITLGLGGAQVIRHIRGGNDGRDRR
ncbi:hypothetical protein [Actinomadura sp. DC4]|uniref:hypothetical protein n=1 Tax=Actinomadura sp. DC4 TaxID=3055069 RepID=UPI0025B11BD7|nr:hypothetical protein [Actinomadura sp. DC4]MDN3352308.1 hypothetical protein [Actinomadura sp. DC4]